MTDYATDHARNAFSTGVYAAEVARDAGKAAFHHSKKKGSKIYADNSARITSNVKILTNKIDEIGITGKVSQFTEQAHAVNKSVYDHSTAAGSAVISKSVAGISLLSETIEKNETISSVKTQASAGAQQVASAASNAASTISSMFSFMSWTRRIEETTHQKKANMFEIIIKDEKQLRRIEAMTEKGISSAQLCKEISMDPRLTLKTLAKEDKTMADYELLCLKDAELSFKAMEQGKLKYTGQVRMMPIYASSSEAEDDMSRKEHVRA